jgi:rhomboid protease GluP
MADKEEKSDWVDKLCKLAGAFGFNPVRVRWRLDRWRQQQRDRKTRAGQKASQLVYEHKNCPRCGRVNDRADDVCSGCGAKLGGRAIQVLWRIGLSVPAFVSISSLLGLAMVGVYGRMILYEGGPDSLFAFGIDTLFRFGGHATEAVWAGEWWRLGSSIFLHLGLWHLGFNLFALSQIGPSIEELFGRGRMLLIFLLTGVLANLGSEAMGLTGVAIGASGAIMGLCGLVAGWGQRDGTSQGHALRNRMLMWGGYTLVFGWIIGADNAAHVSGFVAGGLIGFAIKSDQLVRSERLWLRVVQTLVGGVVALGLVMVALLPPDSKLQESVDRRMALDAGDANPYYPWLEVCALRDEGKPGQALKRLEAFYRDLDQEAPKELAAGMEGTCDGLIKQREQCREFRKRGLAALMDPKRVPEDAGERLHMEQNMRSQCSWIGE